MKPKPKPKVLEKDIQSAICDYLKAEGVFFWRQNTGGMFDPTTRRFRKNNGKHSMNGVADILGMYKEKLLAIEVKAGNNKPSNDQEIFLQQVADNGGIAIVAWSIDDVKEGLGI